LAESAIKVERLLKNNPRKVTLEDAKNIYREAY
jgi:alcohol dehydrogenase class IV